jgi:hypothetical protein
MTTPRIATIFLIEKFIVIIILPEWKTLSFAPAFSARSLGIARQLERQFTISVQGADLLEVSFASPLYTAVIECAPLGNAVARPAAPPLTTPVPSTVGVPLNTSTNWTLPVAVLGKIVAPKVTVCPETAGLMFAESAVEVVT